MNMLFGGPGSMSGFVLRLGQCLFAASSIGMMVFASEVPINRTFWKRNPPSRLSARSSVFKSANRVVSCSHIMLKAIILHHCSYITGLILFFFFFGFSYLIASMGLQILWSFALACVDMQALRLRRNLQHPVLLSLFVVGDWVTFFF
ncbi:CASP-like protein 5B2 [Vitis vinifera]|uniref:CASP-like protein n=1 Tax=Vitis vinifera TaxID=29760 RepID=A0A438JXQ8_VITVI|nr:CASP-like protein 5B2 [Vitis vinifera]